MTTSISNNVPDKPHQPASFNFPLYIAAFSHLGSLIGNFYTTMKPEMFLSYLFKGFELKKMKSNRADPAFVCNSS